MRVIGLMSGTSYDGIDAAVADLELDGTDLLLTPLGAFTADYPEELRTAVHAALPPARTGIAEVCALDTGIGQAFAEVAERAVREVAGGRADLVVSHGQTLFHWIEDGRVLGTLQLGQPAWIAERTGLPVVADLRSRDVAAGGQGAPLVSYVDALLLADRPGVVAALNLGGIANITVLGAGDPLAYDTGPANALLDAATRHYTGRPHDADGALAGAGRVLPELLETFLAEPYYRRMPPKTTGKELFHAEYLLQRLTPGLAAADVLATLVELTARTVAEACAAHAVTEVVASGGGTRNPVLMKALAAALDSAGRTGSVALRSIDEFGVPSQAKEAYAFAVLGFCSWHGLPATVPTCTGAGRASVLGSLTPGRGPLPGGGAAQQPVRLRVVAG